MTLKDFQKLALEHGGVADRETYVHPWTVFVTEVEADDFATRAEQRGFTVLNRVTKSDGFYVQLGFVIQV